MSAPRIPRVFAISCLAGLAALVAADFNFARLFGRRHGENGTASAQPLGPTVRVHVFDRHGELVGPVDSPRWQLSDVEWRERLTPEQYRVLRNKGTEAAFCGPLLNNKESGVYSCIGCGLPLFSSDDKYNSHTGWPSFFQPIAPGNVVELPGFTIRALGIEILCARCEGHLGHVFEDGPEPTGDRFCLNSAALKFTPSDQLATLVDPAAESGATPTSGPPTTGASNSSPANVEGALATAVFAGGCFWCTEAAFEQLRGVVSVESGYAGGSAATANYEMISTGTTGHAEAIRVCYDPAQISYEQLLDVFFDAHDPTQVDRQGADVGSQYRSAIFYSSEEQRLAARAKIRDRNDAQGLARLVRPIVTKLEPLTEFYSAEEYHQNYAALHGSDPYVQLHARPQACRVREKHAALVKPVE